MALSARHVGLRAWVLVFVSILFLAKAQAQEATEPAKPPPEAALTTPIPLADIVTESEAVAASLRDMRADLSADETTAIVAKKLPAISREIDTKLRENRAILAQNPSVDTLKRIEAEWRRLRRDLAALNKQVGNRVRQLERDIGQLDEFAKIWEQTLAAAKKTGAPSEVLSRVSSVVQEIRQTHAAVEAQRARALTTQTRVGVQDARVANALSVIDQASERVLYNLFLRDGAPLWQVPLAALGSTELLRESSASLLRQWTNLSDYAEQQLGRFVLAVALFAAVAACLYLARRRLRRVPPEEGGASPVFEMPLAMTLLLSLLVSRWIFPQSPRVLWAILGALALFPSVLILRRLIRADLHPLLYALVACFFLEQLRALTAAVELLPRMLLLAEMLLVAATAVWLVRSAACAPESSPDRPGWARLLRISGYLAAGFSVAAILANAFGFVVLADFAGSALLRTSFLALILHAAAEVLDGLITIGLSMRPFGLVNTVSRHRLSLRRGMRRALHLGALLLLVLALLQQLLLRERLFDAAREFLGTELVLGSIRISLGDVLAFALTVWAAFALSRFVRFLLDEDIYPRVALKRGLPYAISHTLHYVILCGGFFLALAALGVDMTRVTILVGAFSVGVGLGLQNIVNNFISGLILLFERPINIGDMVQIDDVSGVVERIGVRASIIRMANGSRIIMPNGKLISDRVINRTLSSNRHGIELPITVAQNTDPGHVIKLLEETATAHPMVTQDPPPQALVVKLGPETFTFELRAWTDRSDLWMQIRSELAIAVSSSLAAENIPIR